MPADSAKTERLVLVRLRPKVAHAAGESFIATRRRPKPDRRTATTTMPTRVKATAETMMRAVAVFHASLRAGTARLPWGITFCWDSTSLDSISANDAVSSAR